MLLTSSRTLADLRRGTVWLEPSFASAVDAFVKAESMRPAEAPRT